ncbi:ACT domain-containing protein [Streptosporangium sp. NPDC048047]|uniref:ACT domain-containing protein n=1 Tax=Streptosporangium sp. NPDC048047 TaxID=3155748 RepID=UPI00343A12DA
MMFRLRVSLPDRPGALGQVARVLGTLGADILQVTVLERGGGRAVDDFTVSWPGVTGIGDIGDRLSAVPGLTVEAAWPTREIPGCAPDYDLLRHVATEPGRAFATLVDAVPGLVGAGWAVTVRSGTGEVVHRSWQAPEALEGHVGAVAAGGPGEGAEGAAWVAPPRPAVLGSGGGHLMSLPIPGADLHLVLARDAAFHRAELDRVVRVVEIVAIIGR